MRQREMERLYELSKALMLVEKETPAAGQVAQHIVRVFEIPGIAVFDREADDVYRAGCEIASVSDNRLLISYRDTVLISFTGAEGKAA